MCIRDRDNNKPMLTVMISEDLVKAGQNAGKLVREAAKLIQCGGGGPVSYTHLILYACGYQFLYAYL